MAGSRSRFFLNLVTCTIGALASCALLAQGWKEGTYASLEDLRNDRLRQAIEPELKSVYRWKNGVVSYIFNDTNGNRIDALIDRVLVLNDTLYVAWDGAGFARMLEQGRYCYFRSFPYVRYRKEVNKKLRRKDLLQLTRGIGAVDAPRSKEDREHYVLTPSDGMVYALTAAFICQRLQGQPEKESEFEREPDPTSIDVLIRYLRYLNTE